MLSPPLKMSHSPENIDSGLNRTLRGFRLYIHWIQDDFLNQFTLEEQYLHTLSHIV